MLYFINRPKLSPDIFACVLSDNDLEIEIIFF